MAIDELLALIPAPQTPLDNEGDWSVAEEELGVEFPADFKEMVRHYGTGEFYGNLHFANPLQPWGLDLIRDWLAGYRELCEACEYDLIFHPERPGLLPWGSDSNGHLYCWWTAGEPDEWSCVQLFHGYEDDPLDIVPQPMTSFLVRFISNEYPNMLGGEEFTEKHHFFRQGVPGLG